MKTHKNMKLPDLSRWLSKLTLLMSVNFPEKLGLQESEIKEAKSLANREILSANHYSTEEATGFYKLRYGEADRLISLLTKRLNQMLCRIDKVAKTDPDIGNIDNISIEISHYFVFCPDAYAMASDNNKEGETGNYLIRFSMPFLAILYGGKVKFESEESLVAFIDSIVLHELVHCLGNMNHSAKFKRVLKKLSDFMQIPKIKY